MTSLSLSLRARLLAGVAFVAIVLVAVAGVIIVTTGDRLIDQVDSRLVSLAPGIGDERNGPIFDPGQVPLPPPDDFRFRERVSDTYEGTIDADGVVTDVFLPNTGGDDASPPDIDPDDVPDRPTSFFTTSSVDGDTTYRVFARRIGDITTLTGVPIDDVQRTIGQLTAIAIAGSIAILAALSLVAWWMIRLGIRPMKEMTDTATRIADGDLAVRVEPGPAGTEVGELAGALNQMLGQIEEAFDERAASEERLRQFVADASHELRTPVTTIRGYAELYRHGGLADPERLADAMRRTEQESARMGRLIEDMLTLARLDEQRPLAVEPVDLAQIAADAANDARVSAPQRTVTLERPDTSTTVVGDPDRIRQVIANVVNNAIVHTDDEVPITITVTEVADGVSVSVRDDGAGMPPEVVDRITERFFRADPARSRHRGGSGLGLSIVDSSVAAMGGSVSIDSRPGEGTSVSMTFASRPPDAT